jgi:capsular polysaccharide transport system permease protein
VRTQVTSANGRATAIASYPGGIGRYVRKIREMRAAWMTFILVVVVPITFAMIYYGVLASNLYVSEAKFVVRGVNGQNIGGLAALFRTLGIARSVDDTFAVQNFMKSRDALRQLDARLRLRQKFSKPEIDMIARFQGFWAQPQFESLYQYYLTRVEVLHSDTTGITTLRAYGFSPRDAYDISSSLLDISEQFVNRINARATHDALSATQRVLAKAENDVLLAQKNLTDFRNREDFVDPVSSGAKTLELVGKLSSELAEVRVRRNELMNISPSHPALPGLNNRIAALVDQADAEKRKIVGTDTSLTMKMSQFERLVLQREFSDRALSAALDSVESARQEARRKQLYIEKIVTPNLPDKSTEPHRGHNILATIVFSFALYGMIWLLLAGGREHAHAL